MYQPILRRSAIYSPGILAIFAILSIHLVQLSFMPGPTTTKPITPLLVILVLLGLFHANIIKCRFEVSRNLVLRWVPLAVVLAFYIPLSLFVGKAPGEIAKYSMGIFVAWLCYWMGHSSLCMNPQRFRRLMLYSFYPVLILGIVEVAGMAFIPPLHSAIGAVRDFVLTYNIDKERLHLLFSEPSFMATYLLLLLYLVKEVSLTPRVRNVLYALVVILVLFSASLSVLFVMLAYALMLFYSKGTRYFVVSVIVAGVAAVAAVAVGFGTRVLALDTDLSSYIRFLNFLVLLDMGTQNYWLGGGIGGFSGYFANYLSGMDLRGSTELERISSGEQDAATYSMIGQMFGYMGIPGLITFLMVLFYGKRNKETLTFKLPILVAMFSALPWGLPYGWILLGMVDHDAENKAPQ